MTAHSTASSQLADLWAALGGAAEQGEAAFTGQGSLPSKYPVTSFAAASIASGGVAIAELLDAAGESRPAVTVDRALAGAWFGRVNRAIGWEHAEGSSLTGEYQAADGRWLRLQMNYPRPRDRMLAALGCAPDRSAVAAAIGALPSLEVEDLLAEAGGAAAIARTTDEWAAHPQGIALEGEQLVDVDDVAGEDSSGWRPLPGRPLAGIRVLDMTRVLAGPMGTRFLAGYGAEVLRIDPPDYHEPRGAVLVSLGKRCARVDATTEEGRRILLGLLADCDVFMHGYRDGALDKLGLGAAERERVRPGLVEVTLTAYGWSGPWRTRRGFDTVVEMAVGMGLENQAWEGAEVPKLMPVQALDYGTGHLMAAAAIRGLTRRMTTGRGSRWRLALARTARHLMVSPPEQPDGPVDVDALPWEPRIVATPRGPAYRLAPPIEIESAPQYWDRPGEPFGASMPVWAREDAA